MTGRRVMKREYKRRDRGMPHKNAILSVFQHPFDSKEGLGIQAQI